MEILSYIPRYAWFILSALLCLFFIDRIIVSSRTIKFKGPWLTNWSHFPHSKALLGPSCHDWYTEISTKYGPIARIAPGLLITSSAELWAHMNKHPGYKRSDWYYRSFRFEHQRDHVVSQTDNDKHDQRRKQMAPGYSGKENLELEPAIDERLAELLDLIRAKYVSSHSYTVPMDLAKKVQYFTIDVISSVGLGKPFGMLRTDSDVDEYLKSTEEGLVIAKVATAIGIGWLSQAPVVGPFIAPSPKDKKGLGRMMAACFRCVDERMTRDTDQRSDMLASFVRHGVTGDDLKTEALEQIVAGSDTTASALRGLLLHTMTNARVYNKLQREIDDAVREGKAPRAGEGLISAAQARQLPYLQAVIRESMRVRPPVTNIFPRDVPPAGDTVSVDGETVFLPPGVCIGYSANAIQQSETYGKDAKAFRPERWLEAEGEKLAAMVRTNNLIFGYGRFMCLGKTVAEIEIGKTLFELLRNFDLALMNPARPWEEQNVLGLFFISDMWVQVTERGQ